MNVQSEICPLGCAQRGGSSVVYTGESGLVREVDGCERLLPENAETVLSHDCARSMYLLFPRRADVWPPPE